MNLVILSGRLGADAEVKYTNAGTPMASFRIAHDLGWGDNKKTMWISCLLFGSKNDEPGQSRPEKLGQYLTKGTKVVIQGELQQPDAFNTRDGELSAANVIFVRELEFMSSRDSGSQRQSSSPVVEEPAVAEVDSETVPF